MVKNRDIEQARAIYYKFFETIFSFIDTDKQIDDISKMLELFLNNPMSEESKNAIKQMILVLENDSLKTLKDEQNAVFVSPDSTFVPMSVSYFDEGRDDGQKRVKAAGFVFGSKFRKNEFHTNDPDDNITFLFSFMNALINSGVDGDEEGLKLAKEVFKELLNECLDEFADILYIHEKGDFYKNSAVLLGDFIEFERFYLGIDPSHKSSSKERTSVVIKKDRKPFAKRVERDMNEIKL
ncbi:MAG: molecular chaperone TorD family protein [Campylobacteraceae bacterium]|jgi:TorA maturation chaperone TorD|nr:molecular chaperone TorD family protein [Campylobacteraceae bacterium]